MPPAIRLGLGVMLSAAAFAQSTPDVAEILKKVSETYKAASQYELAADLKLEEPGASAGVRSDNHVRFAFKAPNRYRVEGAIPGLSSGFEEFSEALIVHDGSTVWVYLPKSNQYTTIPGSSLTADAPGDLGDLRPEAMDHFMMWRYREAPDFGRGSKFLRKEALDFGSAKVDCYVLAVAQKSGGSGYTWWVDAKRYLILREDHADSSSVSSTVFTAIKLGQPLSDELFKFKPPAGARKIEDRR